MELKWAVQTRQKTMEERIGRTLLERSFCKSNQTTAKHISWEKLFRTILSERFVPHPSGNCPTSPVSPNSTACLRRPG